MAGEMSEKQAGKQPQQEDDQPPRRSPSFPPPSCPRCTSDCTKFCYYNNNSVLQPRYYCKNCHRYWTHGGTLQNIPIGGTSRKRGRADITSSSSGNGASSSFKLVQLSQPPPLQISRPPPPPQISLPPPSLPSPPQISLPPPPPQISLPPPPLSPSPQISRPPPPPQISLPPPPPQISLPPPALPLPIRIPFTTGAGSSVVNRGAFTSAITGNMQSSNGRGIQPSLPPPPQPPVPPFPSFFRGPPSYVWLPPSRPQQQRPQLAAFWTNGILVRPNNTINRFLPIGRGSTSTAEEVSTSEWTDLGDMETQGDLHPGNEPTSP